MSSSAGLIFTTRTAIPTSGPTALPQASSTYVSKWSAFLNQFSLLEAREQENFASLDIKMDCAGLQFDISARILKLDMKVEADARKFHEKILGMGVRPLGAPSDA